MASGHEGRLSRDPLWSLAAAAAAAAAAGVAVESLQQPRATATVCTLATHGGLLFYLGVKWHPEGGGWEYNLDLTRESSRKKTKIHPQLFRDFGDPLSL